jgi:hypothetical protein
MSFERDGYEIYHSFVDSETIRPIQEATARACQRFRDGDPYCLKQGISIGAYARSRPDRNPGVDADTFEREPYILSSLAGLDVDFRRFLSRKSLWNVAAQLLEIDPTEVVYHFSSVNRKPAKVGPGVGWHRDFTNEYISTVGPLFLRLMIALDPMNEDNAGIGIVPGSHSISDEEVIQRGNLQESNEGAFYPNLAPGDLLAIHSKLIHGGGPNRSQYDRQLMVIQFGKQGATLLHFTAETEYLGLCQRQVMSSSCQRTPKTR